jgi:transposase
MRSDDAIGGSLFSYIDLEKRVRADHPLRVIREVANAALKSLSDALMRSKSCIRDSAESIPLERLMRALLLQAFYSVRSERQLVERIDDDLLFRWFVGLDVEDPVWDATTVTKSRDRLREGDIAAQFLTALLSQEKVKALLSERALLGRRGVVGSLGMKSFRPKDGSSGLAARERNGEPDFHGERRSNDTRRSSTDPDARLARKGSGKEVRLYFIPHSPDELTVLRAFGAIPV